MPFLSKRFDNDGIQNLKVKSFRKRLARADACCISFSGPGTNYNSMTVHPRFLRYYIGDRDEGIIAVAVVGVRVKSEP